MGRGEPRWPGWPSRGVVAEEEEGKGAFLKAGLVAFRSTGESA